MNHKILQAEFYIHEHKAVQHLHLAEQLNFHVNYKATVDVCATIHIHHVTRSTGGYIYCNTEVQHGLTGASGSRLLHQQYFEFHLYRFCVVVVLFYTFYLLCNNCKFHLISSRMCTIF